MLAAYNGSALNHSRASRRRARRLFLEQLEQRFLLAVDLDIPAPLAAAPLDQRQLIVAASQPLVAEGESASPTVIYHEDFENDDGGYMADNSGGSLPGMWHYSVGRRSDGLPNHTPIHSWYYGEFETATGGGRYDIPPRDHEGVLMSPDIPIPACISSELTFNYVLDTRLPLDIDFVTVSVFDGTTTTEIMSRASGSLVQTGNNWITAMADLTPFAGQSISLKFSFDTGDAVPFDPEGWYIDDVLISSSGDGSDCAKIAISPPKAANQVGDPHTLTANVMEVTGSGFVNAAGEVVSFAIVGDATFVDDGVDSDGDGINGNDAVTGADGNASVQIVSNTTGLNTITASSTLDVAGFDIAVETDGTGNNSGPAKSTLR